MSRRTGTWREYRFVLILGTIALGITSIPYVLGAAMTTDERVFGGFVYAIEDCYSYLSKMRQGAEGAWLSHLAYTPEPHPPAPFFMFHLLLGKVAALTCRISPGCRLSPLPTGALASHLVVVYHLARWVFGLGLLLTLYRFLAALADHPLVRRLAWLMVTFGGGLGWSLVSLGQPEWLGSLPLDFILPEGFTFLVLFAFPHIALGGTLLLWGILSLLRAWQIEPASDRSRGLSPSAESFTPPAQPDPMEFRPTSMFPSPQGSFNWAIVTGFLWLVMGLIVPFYVVVAWAVAGAVLIAAGLRERHLLRARASLFCLACLISAPVVLYSAWRFTSDPTYATWAAQNRILSPHPLHYVAAYGVPLSLATLAVRDAWAGKDASWVALAWVGVTPLMVYLPFNLQRRLIEGAQVPLSLLAAIGLVRIADPRSGAPSLRRHLVIGLAVAVLLPTNVMMIAGSTMALWGWPDPIFRDSEEIDALDWASQHVAPNDVILAAYGTGNYLPARVRARAFVGHGSESVRADQKKTQVALFFDSVTEDAWRRNLLAEYGVDYVFWGPKERDLGPFDPSSAPYLQSAYDQGGYSLFEVVE